MSPVQSFNCGGGRWALPCHSDARERNLLAATGSEAGGMGQHLEAGKGKKMLFSPPRTSRKERRPAVRLAFRPVNS